MAFSYNDKIKLMKLPILLIGLSISAASPTLAGEPVKQPLDAASQQGVHDTQQMLTDPTERKKVLERDSRAGAVDAQARKVVGDENMADVYALAADLMGSLANETGGDPVKLMELMERAEKNPEILRDKLTPEQMAKLRAIAGRIPAAAPQSPPATPK
jgi:hypothetical protein